MSITEIESTGLVRTVMPLPAALDPATSSLPDGAERAVALAALAMTGIGVRPTRTQAPARAVKPPTKLRRLAKPSGDYRAAAKGRRAPADDEDDSEHRFDGLL